jgi:hypothetical protein
MRSALNGFSMTSVAPLRIASTVFCDRAVAGQDHDVGRRRAEAQRLARIERPSAPGRLRSRNHDVEADVFATRAETVLGGARTFRRRALRLEQGAQPLADCLFVVDDQDAGETRESSGSSSSADLGVRISAVRCAACEIAVGESGLANGSFRQHLASTFWAVRQITGFALPVNGAQSLKTDDRSPIRTMFRGLTQQQKLRQGAPGTWV